MNWLPHFGSTWAIAAAVPLNSLRLAQAPLLPSSSICKIAVLSATNPRSLRAASSSRLGSRQMHRYGHYPQRTPPADAATTSTLQLHSTIALRHGSHSEAHHRRYTPSARLRRQSEFQHLGNYTFPSTRSIAFADRATDVPLHPMECLYVSATPTDNRSVSPSFRHGVTDCYIWLQSQVCSTFAKLTCYVPDAESVSSQFVRKLTAFLPPHTALVTTPFQFRAEFQHSTTFSKAVCDSGSMRLHAQSRIMSNTASYS